MLCLKVWLFRLASDLLLPLLKAARAFFTLVMRWEKELIIGFREAWRDQLQHRASGAREEKRSGCDHERLIWDSGYPGFSAFRRSGGV